ncbi:hypothetical protein VTK56DRAFT_3892 [Thermocarpiscus australiensis]
MVVAVLGALTAWQKGRVYTPGRVALSFGSGQPLPLWLAWPSLDRPTNYNDEVGLVKKIKPLASRPTIASAPALNIKLSRSFKRCLSGPNCNAITTPPILMTTLRADLAAPSITARTTDFNLLSCLK